ncbi:Gamma-aminobutyric acid type B receptor subunit 1 [Araneus ventricosus]|uniref:Gamma-aminobutyric acid type B receptor subunit 1 n=1 Tax=Araneus ventricosus TaxID=182803 RepID=A0A4Y2R4N6_ARAVE|nr:Gamma-aminobutyric acid type B receptor subunit 1 [Araneus ventricosus]
MTGLQAEGVRQAAYKQKVYGRQYVWFLIGWYEDDWYTFIDKAHNCTVAEMKEAVEGHLTTEALMLNQGAEPTISGMVTLPITLFKTFIIYQINLYL